MGNLNKSTEIKPTTTTALKVAFYRTIIIKTFNPPFRTKIYLVKVLLSVKIAKQDLHRKQFLTVLYSQVKRGYFNSCG